jgi:RHS repeat-associated protein
MSSLRILPAFGLLCLLSLPAKATPTVHWTCSPSSTVDVGQQYTLTVTAVPGYGDAINAVVLQRDGPGIASGPTVATYTHSETAGGSVTFTALIIFTNTQNHQYGVQYPSPPFTLTVRPNHPPTIAWLSAPASATYGQQYYIQAQGQDVDGDLTTVNIYRNGQPFAFGYDPAGDGTPRGNKANSGNPDIAPSSLQTIEFKAVAIDARGNSSATIYCYVTILSPHAPVLDDAHFSIPYIFQTTDVVVNGHDVDGDMKLIGAWVDGDNPTSPTAAFPGVYSISHAVHHHQNPGPYAVTAAYWVDLWDWSDHETFLYSGQLITQNRVVGLPAITASRVDLTLGDSLNLTTAQHDADGNLTQHMMYYKWMPPGGSSYGEQQLLTAQQQYQNGVYDAAYQFVWTPTAAGTYQVYAYGTDPYSTAQSTPITVTVERLPNTITFSLPTQSYVYGQPFNVNAYASSGLAVYYTTDPSSTGGATYSGTTGTATRAGSLKIWAHQDGDATYNPAQPVSQTVTIARATPTVTWATPAAITYGAALSSTQLNATASVPGTFAYTPALGAVVGAGNRTLSVTFTPSDATNYASVTATTSLLVNKASLTVTANNAGRVYGAANPALTYAVTGLVNGDAASVVTGVTVSTTAGTASAVGTYPITASGGSAANYNLAHAAGTLTVTRAGLTITANNASRVYGAANPALTYVVTGLVNGDTASVVTGVSVATTATASSGVGGYAITASGGNAANYTLSYAPGTLTVTAAGLTITASNASKTYGAANPALTYTVSGLVNGDTAGVVSGVTETTTATASSPVGSYAIAVTGGTAANYTLNYVAGTLTVGAASLTITANPASKTYGAPNPGFTASYSGWVNGDTPSVVSGLSLTTTATPGSGVGTYPITGSGASAANYTIHYAAGTLTVNKAPLTITANHATRAYGAANPMLTASYLGLMNGDTSAVVSGLSLATTATTSSNVGTYPITGSGASAANYTIGYAAGTLTITQAVPTLTWATPAAIWSDVALGSAQLNATATVPGSFSYSPAAGTLLTVGSHSLSVTFAPADTANYQSVTKTVVFTVMDAMADDDGDGLPNRWEVQNGLDPHNPSDALLDPDGDGYTILDSYNLWDNLSSDAALPETPIILTVVGKGSGTVTVSVGDQLGVFTFAATAGNPWVGPLYGVFGVDHATTSLRVNLRLGAQQTVHVSSSGLSDFIVKTTIDPWVPPMWQAQVECNGKLVEAITKAQIIGNTFDLKVASAGFVPFATMDTSKLEIRRMITFGLGSSRSGDTPGRIVFSPGQWMTDTPLKFATIKGPALEGLWTKHTHTQLKVPEGYVDVDQKRSLISVRYFAPGTYPFANDFFDFSSATPVAAYAIAIDANRNLKITKTAGGATAFLEYETQNEHAENVDYAVLKNYSPAGDARFWRNTQTMTVKLWPWRTEGAARSGLTKIVCSTYQIVIQPADGAPNYSFQPITHHLTRYLGPDETSAVGSIENRLFDVGDRWLLGGDNVYRGAGEDIYRDVAYRSSGETTAVTSNLTGGERQTEYFRSEMYVPSNLGDQPAIAFGQPKFIRQSFCDYPLQDVYNLEQNATDLVTSYTYNPELVDGQTVPLTATTRQGTTVIGQSNFSYVTGIFNNDASLPTVTKTVSQYARANDPAPSRQTIRHFGRLIANLDLRSKPIAITGPDDTKTSYCYQRGNLAGDAWSVPSQVEDAKYLLVAELSGKTGSGVGTYSGQAIDPLDLEANRSTVTERIIDPAGRVVREAHYVYTSSGSFARLDATYYAYDLLGNLRMKADAPIAADENGVLTTTGRILFAATYDGWRKTSETDEQGVTRTYTYDDYDHVKTMVRTGASSGDTSIAATTTTYAYDAIGRLTSETVSADGVTAAQKLVTSYTYDTADRPKSRTQPGGFTTAISYDSATKTTTTLPGGGTKIEEVYADGRSKSVTGTAVPDSDTTYSFDAAGNLNTVQTTGGVTTTTVADWLGRTTSVTTATWDGGTRTVSNTYDSAGHLTRQDTKSGAVTLAPAHLYSYDAYGRLDREALDANANGVIDPGTDYNVKQYVFAYQLGLGTIDTVNWYRYETQLVWPYDGAHSADWRSAYQHYEQVSGLTAAVAAHTVVFDFDRNLTETVTAIDRANRLRTIATTTSGTSQTLSQTFLNGLPIESTNAQGQTTLQTYDALGRLKTTDDPRTGATTYAYQDGTTLVASVTAPDGEETQYGYDAAGRVATQIDPAGKQAYYQYDAAGNLTHQWGDIVSPVRYEYNALGQRTVQHTYRSGTWTDATLPAGFANAGDVTTWTYQATTGLLTAKTDAKGATTHYEYNALGQKSKRTDARGWVTNYTYNAQALPATVDYTGTAATVTTDLGYTYDREGKVKTVTDAAGTRTFSYYESWTDDGYEAELRNKSGRLQSETLPAFLGGHTLTYDYQYGVSGRANGAASGLQLDTGSLYSVAYGYDAVLRPGSVTYNGGTPWIYSYVANANLIDTVSQAGGYFRDYDYLSTSNRLDKMKHQWGTNSASAVETRVTYDPSSQLRNTEKTQGSAWMTVLGRGSESGVHTDYSYTDRYELTSSGKYVLQPDGSVGAAVTGTARDYAFDPMGNRTSDQTGSYTPNELNQYTATPTAATLTYDANGNLTGDGAATYAYDAENRLITMNRDHGASSHYTYDYLGRRIRRTATGMTTQRYLYDGWNLIAELDDSGTITRQFVWGLDVSGSAQGAGGVGGLLEIDAGGTSQYYPIYDASHNVIGLYSGTGAIAAAYEYDPFGNKQTGLGTYAAANPFRFSTKYTDPDSGLVYYGMRYYSAKLGRFLNQDPIEEAGGINLYAFCGNDGVNRWDLLGMWGFDNNNESSPTPNPEEPPIVSDPFTVTERDDWADIRRYENENTFRDMNASRELPSFNSQLDFSLMNANLVASAVGSFNSAVKQATARKIEQRIAIRRFWAAIAAERTGLDGVRYVDSTIYPTAFDAAFATWWEEMKNRRPYDPGISDVTLNVVSITPFGAPPILSKLFGAVAGAFGRVFGRTAESGLARQTTILGENMSQRVIPFAERTGARDLGFGASQPEWRAMTPAEQWRLNDGMLRARINEGDAFRYIGQDPLRNPALRTQFDLTGSELLRLESRGIPYETVSPSEVISVLGHP